MEDIKEASDKGCMGKLMSGDYRLVDVFWGGFFIVGGILTAFNNRIETLELGFLGTILLSIFYLFISVGVWKSANKYRGKKVWVILAKIAVIFTVIRFTLTLSIVLFGYGFTLM